MKNPNRLPFSSECLAIARMPSTPSATLSSIVQTLAEPLSLNYFWQFFTPKQSPRWGQSLRCMTRREQALSAEVAHYAEEIQSLRKQLAEKEHLAAVGALTASLSRSQIDKERGSVKANTLKSSHDELPIPIIEHSFFDR